MEEQGVFKTKELLQCPLNLIGKPLPSPSPKQDGTRNEATGYEQSCPEKVVQHHSAFCLY